MVSDRLKAAYGDLCAKFGWSPANFPLDTEPLDGGQPYLDVAEDGTMAVLGMERGQIVHREPAPTVDDLMFLLAEMRLLSLAFRSAASSEAYDYEGRKRWAINEMRNVSPEWGDRLKLRMGRII